ncbi:MAG: glycosyltransferase [Propionicimonas sp.]|uniref:glycosyltransferase n=1 Tax=Propionicimonas sp. TaxID=1955623 RepID=UPI003D0B5C21
MPAALRICFVSMHTSPAAVPGTGDAGGMNVVELAQADALAALGHQVDLVTRRSHPDDPDTVELQRGVTLHHVDAGPRTPLAKSAIDDHIGEFSAGLARLAPPDVVHSHHWMSGVAALPVARTWGVPHVQSFHSVAAPPGSPLSAGEPPESPRRVPGEAAVAKESQAVVAISAAEAQTVIDRCGADPDRVSIVSPGVDHTLFRPLAAGEERWNATGGEDAWPRGYVLIAARLEPLKGPDLAIQAVAGLDAEIRPHLVVAGDASSAFASYGRELHAMVADAGLSDGVTFLPAQPRPELARLLRGARVLLVPSHSETFGLVALEAAASGTPVIAASAGGLREAVAHGVTGQLMDSRRPEDWSLALTRLLMVPGLLARMGAVSRVHARRFDWGWAAQRLVAVYRQLLDD